MLRGLETNAAASLVGQVLRGRYRLLKLLGAGGMGAVYRAEHIHLETIRAIKVMLPRHGDDPTLIKRFLREARGLARLDHPNVVSVVDTGETEHGLPFIAMEFLEGEALSTTLNRDGPLPWSVVKHIARQVCPALHAAHELGIIHRDVKPDNCFRVYDDDDGYRIKLLDFGIARFQNDQVSQLTETGSLIGTLPYMSYEQICGEVCDRQSDIWSTAVMFYQLLTGVLPFRGKNVGQLSYAIVQHHPTPVSEVRPDLELPPPLDIVLSQALAKEKVHRYRTMLEFLDAIDAVPDPLGYIKTAPFTNPKFTANTQPAHPEVHQNEPEKSPPADIPQTLPWHGAAISNNQDDIAALAKGELTFDSKSVNLPDAEVSPPPVAPPIIRREGPSFALIALTMLVAVLAAWAVVDSLGGTGETVATAPEKTEVITAPQGTTPKPSNPAIVREQVPEKNIVQASGGGSPSSTSPELSTDAGNGIGETEGPNHELATKADDLRDGTKTPSEKPAPKQPSKHAKKKTAATKKPTATKKPRPEKTEPKQPPPAPEITCASLRKSRSIQKCIANCTDCTPPIKVSKKVTSVVILGTNKSAESTNGKSLTACFDKAIGAMEGPLALEKICKLN